MGGHAVGCILCSTWCAARLCACFVDIRLNACLSLQILRVLPYSACQLCSYDIYKRLLGGPDGEQLSVPRRLAAGAAAGMTSTLVRQRASGREALCCLCASLISLQQRSPALVSCVYDTG